MSRPDKNYDPDVHEEHSFHSSSLTHSEKQQQITVLLQTVIYYICFDYESSELGFFFKFHLFLEKPKT